MKSEPKGHEWGRKLHVFDTRDGSLPERKSDLLTKVSDSHKYVRSRDVLNFCHNYTLHRRFVLARRKAKKGYDATQRSPSKSPSFPSLEL